MFQRDHFKMRVFMSVIGVFICAFSVGAFKNSLFGVDPFQCFSQGFYERFFTAIVAYGSFYIVLNALMLVVDLFLDKHYIGLATLINLFLTGYIVDYSQRFFAWLCPDPSMPMRIFLLLLAIILMCFASALYMTADLGVSVYDAIPIIISNKTGFQFRFVRIVADCICVLIGLLCGLVPGIGTLITALFMGPLIDFFNRKVAQPLLVISDRKKK